MKPSLIRHAKILGKFLSVLALAVILRVSVKFDFTGTIASAALIIAIMADTKEPQQ